MRTLTKKAKKVLNWEEFKNGLARAGFSSKPEHPDWMLLNTEGENVIVAIPGDNQDRPLPGQSVYDKNIHIVWFATRNPGGARGASYETSAKFPASILS